MSTFTDAATALTAVASAIAAGAAWRSASSSSAASRDAQEALGLTIIPGVTLSTALGLRDHVPVQVEAMVTNMGYWPASDLRLEVRFKDGHTQVRTRELLSVEHGQRVWGERIEGVQVDGSDGYAALRALVDAIVVSYSDARGIRRYEDQLKLSAGWHPISEHDLGA